MSCSPMTAMPPVSKPSSKPQTPMPISPFAERAGRVEVGDRPKRREAMIGEDGLEALARPLAPADDEHGAAFRADLSRMRDHRVEDIGRRVRPLGREASPLARLRIEDARSLVTPLGERRERRRRRACRAGRANSSSER